MRNLLVFIISFLLTPFTTQAQSTANGMVTVNLPVISLLKVMPTGAINLSLMAPIEAGNRLTTNTSNNSKWINYTSATSIGQHITASVNQTIPGVNIRLVTSAAASTGGGTKGIPSSIITLNQTPQTIISGIMGAYTGSGVNNGHQITLSVDVNVNGYSNIQTINNSVITITYTITE